MWEFLDKVVYINLDHREDRRKIMEKLFQEGQIPSEKVHRFSAVKHRYGIIGTALSHIGVIELAKQQGWNRILILEDDMTWNDFESNYKKLEELVATPKWDVCMLGGLYMRTTPPKINTALWTNGYIVQSHYYDTLSQNYKEGVYLKLNKKIPIKTFRTPEILKQALIDEMVYADHIHNIDAYWIKLQIKDNWIGVIPKMIKQVPSWSDLLNGFVDRELEVPDINSWYAYIMERL